MMNPEVESRIAEECSLEIVECVRGFVDALRTEFQHAKQRDSNELYSRMVECGVLADVEKVVERQHQEWKTVGHDGVDSPLSSINNSHNQPALLLEQIILPLLHSLTACYRVLDAIPQPSLPPPPSPPTSNTSSKSRQKNKPAPPRGMLSLQQYTDIACLLEFTVCTGILPSLDAHVLTPIDDRIRYFLPKSLGGRIPRLSLMWGSQQQWTKTVSDESLLVKTATAILELLLLDRFRPMLLPRHVTDIFAAVFQYENVAGGVSKIKPEKLSLYVMLGLEKASSSEISTGPKIDDVTLHAKAYQNLLLQGTKTPKWLRQRVSPLLTELACTSLAAIVQVFVPLQNQEEGEVSSMASQRLGRTLAASSAGSKCHSQGLGRQMRQLMEMLFPAVATGQIPARAMAILQTIWAVMYHWPKELVHEQIFILWEQELMRTTSGTSNSTMIHKIVRQMGSLCASVPPPATGPWRILRCFFQTFPDHSMSIFNQLIRLSSMPQPVIKPIARDDARQVLHWLCQATASTPDFTATGDANANLPSGPAFLASAWVHGISPIEWDMKGSFYKALIPDEQHSPDDHIHSTLDSIRICQSATTQYDVSTLVEDIIRRADVFFHTSFTNEKVTETDQSSALQGVASFMFRLLLRLYLRGSLSNSSSTKLSSETSWTHQLVAISMLPVICEKCSPEHLLFGGGNDALGLLFSIRVVLSSTHARLNGLESDECIILEDEDFTTMQHLDFLKGIEAKFNHLDFPNRGMPLLQNYDEKDETMLSITSIILSLLVALLELGSNVRSVKEEEALQSFLPILSSLASFQQNQASESAVASQGIDAGISDMAAYSMALIASRKAQSEPEVVTTAARSTMDRVKALFRASQDDLASTQPPIRARGMVSLGRLARGYMGILKPKEDEPKLVVEVDDDVSQESLIQFTVQEILRLSMQALADEESYVYLAAIQTIVAVADMQPKHVLPIVGASIVTGVVGLEARIIEISNEQRIKLAEALMFTIRRRAAPQEYFSRLINLMIFGNSDRVDAHSGFSLKDEYRQAFAQETDKYFLGEKNDDLPKSIEDMKKKWREQDIRLNTGGPVFELEEQDLVRSIRLSTLAELASVAKPSQLAPYCRLLVRLVVDVLRLDKSRPSRRAAALVARELYGCLLREEDELGKAVHWHDASVARPLSLAVALVSVEEEEILIATLKTNTIVSEKGGQSLNDPATAARCEEALAFVEQAQEVLLAARLLQSQDADNTHVPTMIKNLVENKAKNVEITKLNALV